MNRRRFISTECNTFRMIIHCNYSHVHVLGSWITDHDGITSCHLVDSITFVCTHPHQQFARLKNRNKIHIFIHNITKTRRNTRLSKLACRKDYVDQSPLKNAVQCKEINYHTNSQACGQTRKHTVTGVSAACFLEIDKPV